MTAHSGLTASADIHVCKGADTAAVGKIIRANGAGGQSFVYLNPVGLTYFVNYAAPHNIVYPAAYTKIAPVTVAGGLSVEVTEGVNARLTYTGTETAKFRVICNLSVAQSSGANRDIGIKLHKNGVAVAGSEIFTTASTAFIQLITSIFDISFATNDYVECFVKNFGASGDV